ncbi:MAG TPA: NADPH:quinone oxidoreductase family protein [Aestuariivirgaceae bacterium]|nr:NADPH:quinone oxidoreductase family protein [Aestuariivirgaceae bacterium]
MRALLCTRWGGPEGLTVEELPEPAPGPEEAVVRVKVAALNFFDTLIIQGKYQIRPTLPFSPAAEVAGVVVKTGSKVGKLRVGQRVMGFLGWGGARELVAVEASRLIPIPDAVGDECAAALQVVYGTALHALKDRADLKPGEQLAVLGAAGGTGQAAIEIGKLLGARVIACASSEDKLAFCRTRGADASVNTSKEDLKDALRTASDGRGVDVVFDAVGGSASEAAFRALAWRGRHLVIGFAAGDIPRLPLNLPLLKEGTIVGVHWGKHVELDPAGYLEDARQILQWAADGKIRPHIDKAYPLEEAGQAFDAISRRAVKGKLVLVP